MNRWRLLQTSLLSWFLPFALSVPLVGADGIPVIPLGLFKSIMVVVGMGSGLWLMVWLLANGNAGRHGGLKIGVVFLTVNLLLDYAILLPLSGMEMSTYLSEIGCRYLAIPVCGTAIDWMMNRSAKNRSTTFPSTLQAK